MEAPSSTPQAARSVPAASPSARPRSPSLADLKASGAKAFKASAIYLNSERTPGRRVDAQLPLFFDFVEDRSAFRALTLALFALILLFVFRTALYVVFLSSPNIAPAPPQVFLFAPSAGEAGAPPLGAIEIGVRVPPMWVSVSGAGGEPLAGVPVTLRLAMLSPLDAWATAFRYEGTALAEGGVPLSGAYALPGFPPAALAPAREAAFVGTTAVSGPDGRAYFRELTLVFGLRCAYLARATAPNASAVEVGKLVFTSSVASVAIEDDGAGGAPLLLGGALPRVAVRVRDAEGHGMARKMCVLFNAPAEAAEYTSSAARADIFDPRVALLRGAVSAPSDGAGLAVFSNVTLVASSLRTVRLWAACDGVVARRVNDGSAALSFLLDPSEVFRITLVGAPSTAVTEGAPLRAQPVVRVERALLDARRLPTAYVPTAGVTVIAYVRGQPGFVGGTHAMGPRDVAELQGLVVGTPNAVLANLGRVKHLFGFASAPSGADGRAVFDALGFISHGPAGAYTLGFAVAGVAAGAAAESAPINVISSVASVDVSQWSMDSHSSGSGKYDRDKATIDALLSPEESDDVLAAAFESPFWLTAVVCNFPTCASLYGPSVGGSLYNHTDLSPFPGTFNYTATAAQGLLPKLFSNAPSGALSSGPLLQVRDAQGRPLAGKGATLSAGQGVALAEFPFAGASVSKLSTPQYVTASTPAESFFAKKDLAVDFSSSSLPVAFPKEPLTGALSFLRANLDASPLFVKDSNGVSGNDPRFTYATETLDYGSYLRVVAAPRGHTTVTLTLSVEGVATQARLDVFNLDDPSVPPACAHLAVTQAPSHMVQGEVWSPADPSEAPQVPLRGPGGVAASFTLKSLDSTGAPVAAAGEVGMYVVDALGALLFPANGTNVFFKAEQAHFLRALGGASALAGQALLASLSGLFPAPHVDARPTTRGGEVEFPSFPVVLAQNTWVRFAFVSLQRPLSDAEFPWSIIPGAHEFYPAPAACVSAYSDPVAITSSVAGVAWAAADGSALDARLETASQDVSAGLDLVLPLVQTTGADGQPVAGPAPLLIAVADAQLVAYPAQVGALAAASFFDARPDPSLLPLLKGLFFAAIANSSGADAPLTPLQRGLEAITDILFPANILSGIGATLGSAAWPFDGPIFRLASPAPSSLFKFETLRPVFVSTGIWSFAAFAGGEVTPMPMRYRVLDQYDLVVAVPRAPPPVLTSASATTSPTPSPSPTVAAACPATPCPNGCSGHGACWCGVCVCRDFFEGAVDCSAKLSVFDAGADPAGGGSPYYIARYGGLPVYDVRRALELGRLNSTAYAGELFPRVLLPKDIKVARSAGPPIRQLLTVRKALDFSSPLYSPDVPLSVMVGDALDDALLRALFGEGFAVPVGLDLSILGIAPAASVNISASNDASPSTVFPVLVTCSGAPAPTWTWAMPPRGCASPAVPVTNPFADYDLATSTEFEDRRLLLLGLPTGCYRFQLSYLPRGPGSLQDRTISSLGASAQAVSLGAGPPFRVLSPLRAPPLVIVSAPVDTIALPFDVPLPFNITVRLDIRPQSPDVAALGGAEVQLTDTCSDAVNEITDKPAASMRRCDSTPAGGLEVYATAVNILTNEEHSLYVPGMTWDCARTGGGGGYEAVFLPDTLRLPRSFAAAPGVPRGVSGNALRAGETYKLRFAAFGETADADLEIKLVDTPTHILVSGEGFDARVNVKVAGSIVSACCVKCDCAVRAYTMVDSSRALNQTIDETWSLLEILSLIRSGAGRPLGGVQVAASILYAPINSNAGLGDPTTATSDAQRGIASFPRLFFTAGVAGLYALQLTAPPAQPAILLVNLSNPVQAVEVAVEGGGAGSVVWGAPPLLPAVSGSLLPGVAIRACARGNLTSDPVATFALFAADGESPPPAAQVSPASIGDAGPGEPAWLSFARRASPLKLAAGGAFSPQRFPVDLPLSAAVRAAGRSDGAPAVVALPFSVPLGADGCVTLHALNFLSVPASQRVRLVASVSGVEGPPVDFSLLSLADAHPVNLQTLQTQLWVPLFVILPLFGANSVGIPLDLRAACLAAGLACIIFMGADAGKKFLDEVGDTRSLYPATDAAYVAVLTWMWWVALGVVAALTVAAAAAAAPAGCALLRGAVRRRRVRGAGAALALVDVALWRCGGVGAARAPALRDLQFPEPLAAPGDASPSALLLLGGFHALRLHHCRSYVVRVLLAKAAGSAAGAGGGNLARRRGSKVARSGFALAASSAGGAPPPTLLRRLRSALCSCEDAALAFFFPQRLLVSLLLALFGCVVLALMVMYACENLGALARGALNRLQAAGRDAVVRALGARQLQADLTQAAVLGALASLSAANASGGSSPMLSPALSTRLTGDLLQSLSAAAALSGLPAVLGGAAAPPAQAAALSAQADALASGLSGDAVISGLVDSQVALLLPWVDALVVDIRASVMLGVLLAFSVILAALWAQLLNYRRIVLAVRRGDRGALPTSFAWDGPTASAASATSFVGLQLGGTAVAFVLLTAVFSLVCFLLATPLFTRFLLQRAGVLLLSLLGVTFGLTLLRWVVLNHVTTRGPDIVLRRCHACADLFLTFFNMFVGLMVSVARWALLQCFFFVALIRPDIHVMPFATRVDPFAKAFAALLMHDVGYNSPVAAVAHEALLASLAAVRAARGRGGVKGGGGGGGEEQAAVVVVNPLRGGGAQPRDAAPAAPRPLAPARLRAQTRWHLALLLLQNPSLQAYRKNNADRSIEAETERP